MFLGGGTSVDITGNALLEFKSSKSASKAHFGTFNVNVMIGNDSTRGSGCFVQLLQRVKSLVF